MKNLTKLAFQNKKHFVLLLLTVVLSWMMQISSMMEMYSIGLLTNNGPDFFALFSPSQKNEKVVPVNPEKTQGFLAKKISSYKQHLNKKKTIAENISINDVREKWPEIDVDGKGYITKRDASSYMHKSTGRNVLTGIMLQVGKKLHLSNSVTLLLIMMGGVALFKVVCTFLSRYASSLVGIRVSKELRAQYFEHLQTLPMSFFQKHNIGGLSARVGTDAGAVSASIISIIINYCQLPFIIISCLFGLFMLSFELSLIIFVGLPLLGFPIIFLAKKARKSQKQMQIYGEQFAHILVDYLAGIQTVKLFNMEKFSSKKYHDMNDRSAKIEEKIALYGYISRPVLHMIGTTFLAVIIIYGLYFAKMHVSDLVVYVGLLHLFYDPIKKFGEENISIQRGLAAADRMFSVLDIEPEVKDKPNAKEFTQFENEIKFDKVWFKYDEEWVLKDFSFTVKKGQTVALVGPTGAGKSTIAQLLPRLYDIQKGDILVDGVSIKDLKQKSLREGISSVSQKPFLFYDSVSNNISYGRDYTTSEVLSAAKRAHADEFIQCLPNGYETMLAEMGKNLSGGQQQRLAIARALVKKAPILIMDEATSALDSISENKIKQAILELKGEMTQIIIAHRLSTIEDADKIVYMEYGVKIAEGTREDLYENCSGFKLMWDMMFRRERQSEQESETVLASTD